MSSNACVLAFALPEPEPPAVVRCRLANVTEHLAGLWRPALRSHHVIDGALGLAAWEPDDRAMNWPLFSARGADATAWLHLPSAAGDTADAWQLADAVLDESVHPSSIAPAFALLCLRGGSLRIVTDLIGAVRLFQFDFPNGVRVWASRQGAAHVFAASAPRRSELAWQGMATIGWAPRSLTQMDGGCQLTPASRITVSPGSTRNEGYFAAWYREARSGPPPGIEALARSMQEVIRLARRFPDEPVADLSGGKDSRTIAALGISAGAVRRVHTLGSDSEEVAIAQRLVYLTHLAIEHHVSLAGDAAHVSEPFRGRVVSRHRAVEGRQVARAWLSAGAFHGYTSPTGARFNGLGGEIMAGGSLWQNAWRSRLAGAAPAAGIDRMHRMAEIAPGASRDAVGGTQEAVTQTMKGLSEELELSTAGEVLDAFYMLDRIPHWVNTFHNTAVLCPFMASEALRVGAGSVGKPIDQQSAHLALLRATIPAWARVPFYSNADFTNRVTTLIWERGGWPEMRAAVAEHADHGGRWDGDQVLEALRRIADGRGAKREEVLVARLLWDVAFDDYLGELEHQVRRAAQRIASVIRDPGESTLVG